MRLHALVGAAIIATTFSAPAYAAAAAAPTAAAEKNTDEAIVHLKDHMHAAMDLWTKVKGLKSAGKNASKAEVAKARASLQRFKGMVSEAKAEGKAAKMLALSMMIAKVESDLNKIDPTGAAAAAGTTPDAGAPTAKPAKPAKK
jgi:uncharacterized glyoxalase superfamily protein PhnB